MVQDTINSQLEFKILLIILIYQNIFLKIHESCT